MPLTDSPRPLLDYRERKPPNSIADSVRACWNLDVLAPLPSGFLHHVWPDGSLSLVVVSAGSELIVAMVVGPATEARQLPLMPGASYRGVRFWPDAGGSALALLPREMRNRVVPWEDVLGRDSIDVARAIAAAPSVDSADHMYGQWLAMCTQNAPARDPLVRMVVEQLIATGGTRPISQLASDSGVGLRQLQRRFRARVGLGPKEFARICRGRAALELALSADDSWSALAATLGYADQPHLVRDLARLMGLKPRELRERLALIEHRLLRA